MLLNISIKKKTKWWFVGDENKNHGVLNASTRCTNLFAVTIERDFRYGDTELVDYDFKIKITGDFYH